MTQPFSGLSDADFDAYLPERATSNLYVRPRLETKQKLLVLGRELAARARTLGVALDVHASDERPSIWNKKSVTEQWVFLWRDRDARAELERVSGHERPVSASLLDPTPYHQHAFLALYLNATSFEVALKLHRDAWADVKNLRALLENQAGREALDGALGALPEDFVAGVTGGESISSRQVNAARLGSMLDAAIANASWLYVSRSLSRAEAIAQGTNLRAFVNSAFDLLLPLYRVVAWSREGGLAAVAEDLERERSSREAQAAEAAAREAEWRARQEEEIARRRERALEEARERLAALEPLRPAAVQAAVASITSESAPPSVARARSGGREAASEQPRERVQSAPARRSGREARSREREARRGTQAEASAEAAAYARHGSAARAGESKASKPVRSLVASGSPISLGARVRIATGPFAGQIGTVTELDARGLARVSFGLLSARVESRDLVAVVEKH